MLFGFNPLSLVGGGGGSGGFVEYPIKLERWLMEGAYDRVWAATKREGVPSEEFAVFSEVSGLYIFPIPRFSEQQLLTVDC